MAAAHPPLRRRQIERIKRLVRHERVDMHVARDGLLAEAATQPRGKLWEDGYHGARDVGHALGRRLKIDLKENWFDELMIWRRIGLMS